MAGWCGALFLSESGLYRDMSYRISVRILGKPNLNLLVVRKLALDKFDSCQTKMGKNHLLAAAGPN